MSGDYCFPKHADEANPITVLVIRVYPYKIFMCCLVPSKGRDPVAANRIARFIKECGLTQFTYRSDREPVIMTMFEDACALSGRNGTKDAGGPMPDELSHAQLIELQDTGARLADEEILVDDQSHVPSSVEVGASHTAAPELTHPGESQSNGLAESSVGIFEDQFRTLKAALEQRVKHRILSSHPVVAWLAEHTAFVLNKYALDSQGRTAYGRLHGREGLEKICEFGERVMWFVPKSLPNSINAGSMASFSAEPYPVTKIMLVLTLAK